MSADTERLLTIQEVADMIAVPVATLYQWRSRGGGPVGMRIGRHVRYDPADVRAWLDQRRDPRPAA
ncbi:MAG TPA: helix-turn-helix domain-containing protein [Euzebyales bacterium]|nr:helix-turn-helix domain-containing protein [Euzebyales bacterium]